MFVSHGFLLPRCFPNNWRGSLIRNPTDCLSNCRLQLVKTYPGRDPGRVGVLVRPVMQVSVRGHEFGRVFGIDQRSHSLVKPLRADAPVHCLHNTQEFNGRWQASAIAML